MAATLLLLVPWILMGGVVAFGIREPRPLPPPPGEDREDLPSVTVVVPARNEARNLPACLDSLTRQEYPDFTVVVVDDRSTDDTWALARAAHRGNARSLEAVAGEALPPGWFGKPWACEQGARRARGEILLFTDADTRHGPGLLGSSVAALLEDRADALTLVGEQELGSFGERLLQPHFLTLLGLRYRRLDRPLEAADAADAIANGQYVMVRREAYEAVGGHAAVRNEVVEDLRLAQVLTGAGLRLTVRGAGGRFVTRMYHSLQEVVAGWTKNLAVGARQAGGRWGPVAVPGIVLFLLLFWVAPPALLLFFGLDALAGAGAAGAAAGWAASASFIGLVLWTGICLRFRVPVVYAPLYPVGAALTALVALRSGYRGRERIEWKGRRYARGEAVDPEGGEP